MINRTQRIDLIELVLRFGVLCLSCVGIQILSCSSSAYAQPAQFDYVKPTLWPGVLVLQAGRPLDVDFKLSQIELKLVNAATADEHAKCLWAIGTDTSELPALASLLTKKLPANASRINPGQFIDGFSADHSLKLLENRQLIWMDTDTSVSRQIKNLAAVDYEKLISGLRQALGRGAFVRISGDLEWLEGVSANQICLLPDCQVNLSSKPAKSKTKIQLELADGACLAITGRTATSLNKKAITVHLMPTENYPEAVAQSLGEADVFDWVQWQRAAKERLQLKFPSSHPVEHRLAGGSLVIGGGGGMPLEVWERFVELAGGAEGRIVILPTAVEEPSAAPSLESRLLERAGAKHVVTLPQTKRDEVESDAFLAELDLATGVWFGGGRQWRFVDAYWGTTAWQKLLEVCQRGGVIGGSSAGATIQGELLLRGAPAGNHVMIADGYRRGLGLLPGVAIDQHFSQRNRFADMERSLADFPPISGIGIDEQTALVVTAHDHCKVLGNGSVWLYPSYELGGDSAARMGDRAAMRQVFKAGTEFSLAP